MGGMLLRFSASFGPEEVTRLREKVAACLDLAGVGGTEAFELVTLCDELTCNVLEHSGAAWVELEIRPEGNEVIIMVRDNGHAFDPVKALTTGLENATDHEGDRHLGLFMVKKMAKSTTYKRRGEINDFELRFELKK